MNVKNFYKQLFYVILAVGPFLVDRLTKWLVLSYLERPYNFATGITFSLVKNRGLSWSLLYAQTQWQSYLLIVLVATVIGIFAVYTFACWQRSEPIVGQLLALSGAVSNIVDRFFYGGVVDFIELSACGWSWPTFNIADIAIVVGVCIMLFQQWRKL